MKIDYVTALLRDHYSGDSEAFDKTADLIVGQHTGAAKERLIGAIERGKRSAASRPPRALPVETYVSGFGTLATVSKETGVSLDDLILPEHIRGFVSGIVEEQQKRDVLRAAGLSPTTRMLLHGPSGTGKTSVAKAIATAVGLPFVLARISELKDSYVGETEKKIDKLFKTAASSPCVLCLDEIDSIGSSRFSGGKSAADKMSASAVSAMLMALDATEEMETILVCTTNALGELDRALVRRLGAQVLVGERGHDILIDYAVALARKHGVTVDESVVGDVFYSGTASFAKVREATLRLVRRAVLDGKSLTRKDLSHF